MVTCSLKLDRVGEVMAYSKAATQLLYLKFGFFVRIKLGLLSVLNCIICWCHGKIFTSAVFILGMYVCFSLSNIKYVV